MISEPDVDIIEDIYELSPMQQGMLFHSLYEDNSGAYIVQFSCMINGNLDVARFQEAWQHVIERHSILRTSFHWEEIDKPVQVVHQDAVLPCKLFDWRHLSADEQRQIFAECLQEDRSAGFNLQQVPLMRLILARTTDQSYRLIWSFHHILLDAWCVTLLLPELLFFYEALGGSETPQLDPAPPYSTYIAWLQAQQLDKAEAFWRERLRGFTTTTSPNIQRMPSTKTVSEKRYAKLSAELSVANTARLQAFGQHHQLTLNTLVQGAWAILLHRYSGEEDVLFGSTVAGRPAQLPGVQQIVGLFINTLPARVRVSPSQQLVTWLKTIQVEQLTARRYEYAPLASIQKWSELPAGASLFDTLLVFGSFTQHDWGDQGELSIKIRETQIIEQASYPLGISVQPGVTLKLQASYDQQHYNTDAVQHILAHTLEVLEEFVRNPNQRIGEISITPPDEYELVVRTWNATTCERPFVPVHQRIAAQAARTPNAQAVVAGDKSLTYRQLDEQSNQLAHFLRSQGVGAETPVALALERSTHMLVALLAVLKTGATFVPLDTTLPTHRLSYIVADVQPHLVVASESRMGVLQPLLPHTQLICLDTVCMELNKYPTTSLDTPILPVQLAYICYTSGSTGVPKGVMVPHNGLMNHLDACLSVFSVQGGKGAPVHSPFGFDFTMMPILLPLLQGQFVDILPEDDGVSPLVECLAKDKGWSLVKITPAHLEAINQIAPTNALAAGTDAVVLGGESLLAEMLTRWQRESPQTRIFNEYGPTETVIACTACEITPATVEPGVQPIGRPMPNVSAYVLDSQMLPVPVGVGGELYIGGIQVTRGYLNRPDVTAERFVPDPFGDVWGGRLYRTGDYARWRADGMLDFLGRRDRQIKLRGYRIELGEIEATLRSHLLVHDVAVVVHENITQRKQLVAYIVLSDEHTFDAAEMRTFLHDRLPEYMIPSIFVPLSQLPLTSNGKVNRHALPEPISNDDKEYEPPRTDTEIKLAAIWSEVLGLAQIGIRDNYFGLGGDSILSLRMVALARQQGMLLTPKQIFQNPTIAGLAQVVGTTPVVQAEQHRIIGEAPCTPIQARFFEQCLHNPHHYNQAHLIELPPPVDRVALEKALQAVFNHHDALRTRFIHAANGWQQHYIEDVTVSLICVDVLELAADERHRVIAEHAKALQEGLDITHGPIVRVALFDHGASQPGQLLIVAHHLVVDIVSWNIIIEDVHTAYQSYCRGESSQLPAKTTSYKQWAERLVNSATEIRNELPYWLTEARNTVAPLPIDKTNGANTVASMARVTASLEVETTSALLRDVVHVYHTHINDLLLTPLTRAFQRWTGTPQLLVDLEGHGREDLFDDIDISRTVGWFTAIYPVLLGLGSGADPGSAICAIKEQLRQVPNRGVGYGLLRYGAAEIAEHLCTLPQAEVNFNYFGQIDSSVLIDGVYQPDRVDIGATQDAANLRNHMFTVNCLVAGGQLHVDWMYSTHLHHHETVAQLAQWFLSELRLLVTYCLTPGVGGYTPSDFPLIDIDQSTLDRITRIDSHIDDIYPLTSIQHGILFHSLQDASNTAYFQQFSCILGGEVDIDAFQRAWQGCVERHPIFRTSFHWEGLEQPLQVVHQRAELPWKVIDWRGSPTDQHQARLEIYLAEDRRQGFAFSQAPLMRMALLQFADNAFYFVWSYHHLQLDGWSTSLVLQEIFTSYAAYAQGIPPDLPTPYPFRDHLVWLQKQDSTQAATFWQQELGDISAPTPLGVDRQQMDHQVGYTFQRMDISEDATTQLQNRAQQYGLTLNTLIQGAWAILLGTYSGESDVLFGITVAGRPPDLKGVASMIGLFINTLPLRVRLDRELPVEMWLHQVQTSNAEVRQYENCSLVDIHGWSGIPRQSPLFESLLVFENYPVDEMLQLDNVLSPEASMDDMYIDQPRSAQYTNYPLTITAMPGRTLQLTCTYDRQRFDDDTITRMLDHFKKILAHFTVTLTEPLGQIEVLTAEEREQILYEWNATATCIPEKTIIQLIEQQVARTPEDIAVSDVQEERSYAELNQQATQLAWILRRYGVGPDVPVGVALGRSCDLLMVLLAVWKAGGAYVPLDTSLPRERLQYILEDVQPSVVVTTSHLRDCVPLGKAMALCIDMPQVQAELDQSPLSLPAVPVGSAHLAYIIYTSGSTGTPKGVMVHHGGLTNYLCWASDAYAVASGNGAPVHSPLGFDLTISSLFLPLVVGRRVVLLPDEQGVEVLANELHQSEGYSLLKLTPSHLEVLNHMLSDARTVGCAQGLVLGGEALYAESLARWRALAPDIRLFNEYGPTETVVGCMTYEVDTERTGHIPIGKPVANTQVYVLDGQMRLVPMGVMGELYIGGVQVARGYLNRPELTAERFVPDPFGPQAGGRLYRTGDVVRWRADGQLEYLGRNDHQVKLRGYRVELGEIEMTLLDHPGIHDVVVSLREDVPGDKRLVAYIVADEAHLDDQMVLTQELRAYCEQLLPNYMHPSVFVLLSTLPLTPNGKVDRHALPAPEMDQSPVSSEQVLPRNSIEFRLVQIWERILRVQPIGVTENFFDLGGHSLLVIQLLSAVNTEFRQNLPLSTILQSPTIRSLATLIQERPTADSATPLVAIQPQGTRPPFFCVHPGSGEVLCYIDLAQELGEDQPFYGLEDLSHDGRRAPYEGVESMAADYVQAIQDIQPRGPYLLGGWSFGGIVALEMAHQLMRQGEEVALLALLDSGAPQVVRAHHTTFDDTAFLAILVSDLSNDLKLDLLTVYRELREYPSEEQPDIAAKLVRRSSAIFTNVDVDWMRQRLAVAKGRVTLLQSYEPQPYAGPVTLLRASIGSKDAALLSEEVQKARSPIDTNHLGLDAETRGWEKIVDGSIDVQFVPGTHAQMITPPYVQTLARVLRERIDNAVKAGPDIVYSHS